MLYNSNNYLRYNYCLHIFLVCVWESMASSTVDKNSTTEHYLKYKYYYCLQLHGGIQCHIFIIPAFGTMRGHH